MDTLLKADVFFFITSVVMLVLGLLAFIAFVYFIQILREVKSFAKVVREESELAQEDIHELRAKVRQGVTLAFLAAFVKKFWRRFTLPWRRRASKK